MGTLMISLSDEVKEYLKKVSEAEKKTNIKNNSRISIAQKIMDEINWDYIFEKFSKKWVKLRGKTFRSS